MQRTQKSQSADQNHGPTKTTEGSEVPLPWYSTAARKGRRGRQAPKCRGGFAAVDFSAAVLLQYASKPLK